MKYVIAANVSIVHGRPQVIEIVGDNKNFKTSKKFWLRKNDDDVSISRDVTQTLLGFWGEEL